VAAYPAGRDGLRTVLIADGSIRRMTDGELRRLLALGLDEKK
jgi:hypothetical protein